MRLWEAKEVHLHVVAARALRDVLVVISAAEGDGVGGVLRHLPGLRREPLHHALDGRPVRLRDNP